MSGRIYLKGQCHGCGGHLEFPAEAVGDEIDCPHCGWKTRLTSGPAARAAKPSFPGSVLFVGLVGLLLVTAVVWWFANRPVTPTRPPAPVTLAPRATPAPTPPTPTPHVASSPETTEAAASPTEEQTVEDFAVGKIRLEHEKGTSLCYAVGHLRNLMDHQRFGVKVKLKLYNSQDDYLGEATDYRSVMDPKATWTFKALVLQDQVASATFDSVVEEK